MSTINTSQYLYVFNHVITNGINREGRLYLGKLTAWYDFDGYTCYLGYKDLTMTLYFHNRFSFDYQEETTLKEFYLLIEKSEKEFTTNHDRT
ncbi:DUF3081 family protein [Pseudocolwellia agarivorans]|uniref:DUF3081 family protein n=1 Tax=Pseudocolwellia agarivorans TaxID=1911682 RepID=UPI0009846F27|nr:DUF3081 family protein [Pseudocolwellia agarivorans]